MTMWMTILPSPVGELRLVATDAGLAGILFPDHRGATVGAARRRDDHPVLVRARDQLAAYFAGTRIGFDVALAPSGTPFQHRVWRALAAIPFGATRSYKDIAHAIGAPAAVRAVGAANGKNPLSIIVPCHRVVATSGALTGFAGGLAQKRWLLEHERRVAARPGIRSAAAAGAGAGS